MPTKKVTRKTAKRRAPATSRDAQLKKSALIVLGVLGGGMLVSGVAVLVGRMDDGRIDVAAAIEAQNTAAIEEARERGETAPPPIINNTQATKPNGGLVGKGKADSAPTPPPAPEPGPEDDTETDSETETEAEASTEEAETAETTADTETEPPDTE